MDTRRNDRRTDDDPGNHEESYIRPVPVPDGNTVLSAAPGCAGQAWPGVCLADGIRTVGQWLAYEAGDAWR